MVAYRVLYKQAVHILSGVLVLSNLIMAWLGVAAMVVRLDPWLDILVEDVIVGTMVLNLAFIVIKWVNLNWRRNALARRINSYFSRYLIAACGSIVMSLLTTAVTVLIVDTTNPLHFLVRSLAVALFIMTRLLAIAGGYLSFGSTRMGTETVCADDDSGPAWRFDFPITDDPTPTPMRKPNLLYILKATGIGIVLLLLAIAVYGPFVFLSAGQTIEYWVAGNLSIFGAFLIVPLIFLLARQVPRTRRGLHRWILVVIVIASSSIAAFNTIPFLSSTTSASSIDQQFRSTFGPSWESSIPPSASTHLRDRPVALKDIILTIPIPAVDEQFDIPYMQDKGQTLRFDWYGPAGISATSVRLPVIIALHPGSWRYFDKGAMNVVPTSRYIADQGYIVVDVQYGLHNDSASGFTLKDMIREIGNLTRFLETHADVYHVDLTRTLFMGRSAGAHLALVAGLAYGSPYFTGNYSPILDCRGIIAFYPPADLRALMGTTIAEIFFGVPMADYWHFNPVDLTSPTSPPVLCFHGTADDLVPIAQSELLKARLLANGSSCILGTLSGAGHMFDLFYNNFYNQICIYYIERFLALRCL